MNTVNPHAQYLLKRFALFATGLWYFFPLKLILNTGIFKGYF